MKKERMKNRKKAISQLIPTIIRWLETDGGLKIFMVPTLPTHSSVHTCMQIVYIILHSLTALDLEIIHTQTALYLHVHV